MTDENETEAGISEATDVDSSRQTFPEALGRLRKTGPEKEHRASQTIDAEVVAHANKQFDERQKLKAEIKHEIQAEMEQDSRSAKKKNPDA